MFQVTALFLLEMNWLIKITNWLKPINSELPVTIIISEGKQ